MTVRLIAVCALLLAHFGELFFGGAAFAVPASLHPPALAWVFDIHPDKQLVPQGKVFLTVGTRRVLIEPKAQFEFQNVPRTEYKSRKIPAAALTACTGWYAGGGEDLYVVRRRNRLCVYRRWVDEEGPAMPWKLVRTIAL